MEFTKEKTTTYLNVKNIGKLRFSLGGLILALLVSNLVLAGLFITEPVRGRNGISVVGAIEIYDSDGITPLLSHEFPLFVGGTMDTFTKSFFIRNVGNDAVGAYWNLTGSSISWELRASTYPGVYDHYENGDLQYSFGITQDFAASNGYWHPDWETIVLDANEEVGLTFELLYTGEPNKAEVFTMTVCFYATQPLTIIATVDFSPNSLGLESKGKWVSCCIELPQGCDLNDIHYSSIRLNDTLQIDYPAPIAIGDSDKDGIADLTFRFNRTRLIEWLCASYYREETSIEHKATLKITAGMKGAMIVGYDTIKTTSGDRSIDEDCTLQHAQGYFSQGEKNAYLFFHTSVLPGKSA